MAKSAAKPKGTSKSQLLAQLKQLLADRQSDLAWYHSVGLLVGEIVPESKYGNAEISGLAKKVGEKEPVLYKVRKFARLYKPRELSKLHGLGFGHVIPLLGVRDAALRKELLQKCKALNWTNSQLRAEIQERQGKRSKGGRKVNEAIYVGPTTGLRKTLQLSEAWTLQWVDALAPNLQKVRRAAQKKSNEELRDLLGKTCEALSSLQAVAGQARDELKGIKATAEKELRKLERTQAAKKFGRRRVRRQRPVKERR
jgi:hypothetical protein